MMFAVGTKLFLQFLSSEAVLFISVISSDFGMRYASGKHFERLFFFVRLISSVFCTLSVIMKVGSDISPVFHST